ncbi:hypothetical protein B0H16DRAFT_1645075 [Mycena metata]|uniref:BTB domain-containing protein n=1 Tax=Mycena metata TaxID=1033252 RepID=A0AAD7DUQ3_9AGAR|nr:hypothetical protein B0H16DRAFT_1645075 [Mycena metata]
MEGMENMPPRTKRRHTDAQSEPEPPEIPLTRSTEYWFDDGNIILQVESTQFRLAKSVLSMHSSVFRDMFSLPLPVNEPTIEGCPIVVLQGDTAQDWVLFLGAIFPKHYTEDPPNFDLFAAMLRLSKKYDFPRFRKDCVRRFKKEFPASFAEQCQLSSGWTYIFSEDEDGTLLLPLISLAREIGLFSVLPPLYSNAVVSKQSYMAKILDPENPALGTIDRLACLLGYAKLGELESTTMFAWLDLDANPPKLPSSTCTDPVACRAAIKDFALAILARRPPDIWILHDWNEDWDGEMCSHCKKKAKGIYDTGRETCWEQLSAAFGLPDWEELKSLDFE